MRLLSLVFFCLAGWSALSAQTVILDFETPGTSTTFQYFGSSLDGSLTTVVANPNPSGINTSNNVTRYVKAAGAQVWAGAFSNPNPATPVDVTTVNQVCIKVHFDHIGNVALKLENSSTGGPNWVQTVANTTTGQWEELCFDVTLPSIEGPFSPAAGHVYNTVVLFFDFGTAGAAADVTYYFDDIIVPASVSCGTVLDFEAAATSTTFQYFGSGLDGSLTSVVANPNPSGINTSGNVTRYVKAAGAQVWAGAFSNPNPTTPVDVTTATQVCIKVHFDHIGNVALKLENSSTGGPNWVQTVANTTAGQWEELCFDVTLPSIEGPFAPAAGHVYSTVVLFFDFGTAGGAADVTYYFDDIVVCTSGGAQFADVTFSVDMNEYAGSFTTVYVSGTFNNWSGDANPLVDTNGDGIWETTLSLPLGLHEYKYTLDNFSGQEEFSGTEVCIITDPSGQFVNRRITVSSTGADNPTVCWNSCYACGESVRITINLGTSHITVDSTGMYIAGGGNFGIPGDFPLSDDDQDGVWTITVERPRGFQSFYTFTNGACPDYSCKENIGGQSCANPGNFNDRLMGPFNEDATINTCFALCTTNLDCSGAVSNGNITFRVNMSQYTGSFTQVYVSGSFNSWSGDSNPLSDADGDGIWTGTFFLPGGPHEYKFTLDNWSAQEEFTPGGPCTITDPSGQFVNRLLEVDGDETLTAFCFNSCTACATSSTRDLEADHHLFSIVPNVVESSTWLVFHNAGTDERVIRILNAAGQTLAVKVVDRFADKYQLDASQLPAGLYIVHLRMGNVMATQKFVKQ
jgi:hypothetical protein